jgi:hypothetical protein
MDMREPVSSKLSLKLAMAIARPTSLVWPIASGSICLRTLTTIGKDAKGCRTVLQWRAIDNVFIETLNSNFQLDDGESQRSEICVGEHESVSFICIFDAATDAP